MESKRILAIVAVLTVFSGLALLFLSPCLPSDRAPVSIDPLYADPSAVPFSEARPAGFVPTNPGPSDTAMVFYPWLAFMARTVAAGELPLWSPLCGGGLPMMGNLSSALFFPATWLCFVPSLGVGRGMFWGDVIKLVIAGLGGWLLLRRLGAPVAAAFLAGFGFMLFGYQVVWLNYSLANVSCLLPLCLFFADRFRERTDARRGFALALVLALQFLGGHAETSLAIGVAVVLWLLCCGGWRVVLRFAPYGLLSLALCAFQLAPFVEYLALSYGKSMRENPDAQSPEPARLALDSAGGVAAAVALCLLAAVAWWLARRPAATKRGACLLGLSAGVSIACAGLFGRELGMRSILALLVDPDAWGNPGRGSAYVGPEAFPDVSGGYVGVLALLLAVCFALATRDRGRARFALAAMVIGAGFAAHVEPLHSLLKLVPPFGLTAPTRMLPLFAAGALVAAALAIAEIARGEVAAYRSALLRVLAAAVPVVLAVGLRPDAGPRLMSSIGEPGFGIESPSRNAVLVPQGDGKGGSALRVEIAGRGVPHGAVVRVRVGGAAVSATTDEDGLFRTSWNATRAEAGRYAITAEAIGADGRASDADAIEVCIRRPLQFTLAGIARMLAAVLVAMACVSLRGRWLAVAPLAVAVELFLFGFHYNPASPIASVFPETGVTRFLASEASRWRAEGRGPFRVFCEEVILQPNLNQAYGIEDVRAYDQLYSARFQALLAVAFPGVPPTRWNRGTVDLRSPRFDFLNLAYLVTGAPLPPDAGFELVHDGVGKVYRNPRALPRAFLVGEAIDLRRSTAAELLALDWRRQAILEVDPPAPLGGTGTVAIGRHTPNRVELAVDASGPAILVLTDNDFPGWVATVDGTEVEILRTHGAFRAVAVPAGRSAVLFEYRPASFRLGLLVAVAAFVVGGWLASRTRATGNPGWKPLA